MKQMLKSLWELDLGANIYDKTTVFRVWAPAHRVLSVEINKNTPISMQRDERGYFTCAVQKIKEGDQYLYVFENGLKRPDPVSRSLPHGVHGPTEIIDPQTFTWDDHEWKGMELRECIFYEAHVGVYTQHGTFDAMIQKLDYLVELGINCLEIMPVAQFPGKWNWGYDGSSLYAPYTGYGGALGLKRLVNACHKKGIALCLDVVYNHLGPEGNYLAEFGPYFSELYHTPWGKAFNYDGAFSDEVRHYIISNALHWITEYHIDILRLDAIHGIYDFSARPMLQELSFKIDQLKQTMQKNIHIVAESDLNDSRVLRPQRIGGFDLSGVWNDDFHHATHVAFTSEQQGYYQDFRGLADLAKTLTDRVVYDGQYSTFRKRRHGNSFKDIPFDRFVAFIQNHDQVGNRPFGERLSALVDRELLKCAGFIALLNPFIPLLFMGEEYAERAPFKYFVDFSDEKLMQAVIEGRKKEFQREEMPHPGQSSFTDSKLTWSKDEEIYTLYRQLIHIRKTHLPKADLNIEHIHVSCGDEGEWIAWEYLTSQNEWLGVFCYLKSKPISIESPFKKVQGKTVLLSTHKMEEGRGMLRNLSGACALAVK